ncbi:MAG: hypothetical protein IKG27_04415 [Bacilli bacterium]|nr:hypothetical protein [Bacilli bacterium]
MKKLYSLLKASLTSDMSLFKIKAKGKAGILIPLFIALYLMFAIGASASSMFEKLTPLHLQHVLLSVFVFGISIMTIMEGIYKAGPLMFNCKDDQLLLSLPIERRVVLFVRVFKFYIFELLFNSLFLLPIMIAYIKWADVLDFSFFLTSFVMLFMLPIIPIVMSCIIGAITSSLSSRFKYKNAAQIIISMVFVLGILFLSYSTDDLFNYLIKHATNINDLIIKIYYPAGIYAKLITDFNVLDLGIFILVNIIIFALFIFCLSKVYFKINSRLKKVATAKKTNINTLSIKAKSIYSSLIRKEINTFFKTPVFIVNAGFGLVLFIVFALILASKFDSVIPILTDPNSINLSKDLIVSNKSILIFILICLTAFMTSITNSLISLEGKNINILKSLPINSKTILMSKVYACLVITTPVLLIGDIILFIKLKTTIIESILLIILSIILPLVSHFVGLIVNLKYPKLDAENSAEVVKQSMSSFVSVMIGMVLLLVTVAITIKIVGSINSVLILSIVTIVYMVIDIILYLYLINKGSKDFNNLSI